MKHEPRLIQAKVKLGLQFPEDLPVIALSWLEEGLLCDYVSRVAVLTKPTSWELDELCPKMFHELNLPELSEKNASIIVAQDMARQIINNEISPSKGVYYIWNEICGDRRDIPELESLCEIAYEIDYMLNIEGELYTKGGVGFDVVKFNEFKKELEDKITLEAVKLISIPVT